LLADANSSLIVDRREDAIVIDVPSTAPDQINSVVVLDIDGYPDVIKTPELTASAPIFLKKVSVSVGADIKSSLRYTRDGSVPSLASPIYTDPILLTETATISVRSFRDGMAVSKTAKTIVRKVKPHPARNVAVTRPGLTYKYYEGVWDRVPDFDHLEPLKSGNMPLINLSPKSNDKYFGLVFKGFIKIPETAVYIISIASNDGSLLYIDDELLINNDEDHPLKEERAHVALEKGLHAIKVSYFQEGGSADLKVYIQDGGLEKREIPAQMYWSE
jgi:hypothetical protein